MNDACAPLLRQGPTVVLVAVRRRPGLWPSCPQL